MQPQTTRLTVWIIGILALIFWAQIILGVAVFAIPDNYDPPVSIVLSLIAFAIGVAVPAAAIWTLRAFHVLGPAPAPVAPASPMNAVDGVAHNPLVEPLTSRELEILQSLAVGRSNKEIAAAFVISTGTVKTHTNNLYRKLGASNRTEAVARARQLDLL